MTTQEQVREQVEAYVAGRIVQRLTKLGASEEQPLKAAVSAVVQTQLGTSKAAERHTTTRQIPATVVKDALLNLAEIGRICRIRYQGVTFIALDDTSHAELSRAMRRTFGRYKVDERSFPAATRRPEYLYDAPQIHSSEVQDAYTYEGSVCKDPLDAEIPLPEEFRQTAPAHRPLSAAAQARIDYQDRIGQGERNARRALARYLKTDPVMQQWFARKEMEENARREERKAFQTAEAHSTAMSPEQAYADNNHT